MNKYEILNDVIYYSPLSLSFSLYPLNNEEEVIIPIDDLIQKTKLTAYTFCIDISDGCNLDCDYCFNKNKTGAFITFDKATEYLEKMFELFPNGEKYFIDLSGKGEPLLHLKTVLQIAEWCKNKQDQINVEVLPQLVTNGTLLTKETANILQNHGILFGVSIDGNKLIHNLHRKTKSGQETFDVIISNIKKIKNRKYVGCATTLTESVFSLVDSINYLSKYFNTLSYRPARGEHGFNSFNVDKWIKEYDKLAITLLKDIRKGNAKRFLCLMNGDDYFGRYLNRAFGRNITINRCDAGISRFALDVDGRIYGCPASSINKENAYEIMDKTISKKNLFNQANRCLDCDFKLFCGGECEVELKTNNNLSLSMCKFKKHLILLANYIQFVCQRDNPSMDIKLHDFVYKKQARLVKDEELEQFLKSNSDYSFTKGKEEFDRRKKRY